MNFLNASADLCPLYSLFIGSPNTNSFSVGYLVTLYFCASSAEKDYHEYMITIRITITGSHNDVDPFIIRAYQETCTNYFSKQKTSIY